MSAQSVSGEAQFVGNDRVLFGIIFGVLAFWLFAQTTLNISPVMAEDLGIETSLMNIAVSITALFSGIFIVVVGKVRQCRQCHRADRDPAPVDPHQDAGRP